MSKIASDWSTGSIKRLLYTNAVTLTVIASLLCVGPHISASLSVVASVKVVVEVLCCYLLAANLVLTLSLSKDELPPYRSQRTAGSKVMCMPKNAERSSVGRCRRSDTATSIVEKYSDTRYHSVSSRAIIYEFIIYFNC